MVTDCRARRSPAVTGLGGGQPGIGTDFILWSFPWGGGD